MTAVRLADNRGTDAADGLYDRETRKRLTVQSPSESASASPPGHRPAARQLQLAVFAGGIIGALARAGLGRWLPFDGSGWPWATFVANVAGTAALGYFTTRLQERLPPSTFRRPLLGTGFCGALTTFSTLQIELVELARNGHAVLAAGYLAASLAAGLLVMYLATALTRKTRLR